MDDLAPIAALNGGYLMRHQLNDLGQSDAMIRQAMRAGRLLRVRHGTYVVAEVWRLLSATERHAVLTRSVLDKLGSGVAATHQSAAALHGLDHFDVDLDLIHVTRLDGRGGRHEAGVLFHEGRIEDDELVEVDGRQVIEPLRATFEACSVSSVETGMVLATSAMRRNNVTRDELEEHVRRFEHWPGARRARLAIRLSDPRLESVGEVRSIHLMWEHRIPHPELQWEVFSHDGVLIARVDFAWIAARHTGEFDGMVKYGRFNPSTTEPGRVIEKEKVREDLVRGENHGMTRWVWDGLAPARRRATADRILQGIEQSRRLYCRNATTIV